MEADNKDAVNTKNAADGRTEQNDKTMHWLTLCIIFTVLVVYILVGGAIFMALEKDNEDEVASTQTASFSQFLTDNTCVTASELAAFASAVIQAYDSGVVATSDTSSESNWDYGSSVFFSTTVVTTVGYGHISPSTSGGQVFFIFYAIFGIPLTAVFLGSIGDKLTRLYKKLDRRQFVANHPKSEKLVKIILFSCICYVLFSLIPAAIFMHVEDWTYLEAWYFTMVTLTTVGFGDFVPGQSESSVRGLYKVITTVWLFLGLAWLAMVLSLVGDFMKEKTNQVDNDIEMKIQTEEGKSTSKDTRPDHELGVETLE